ncbi:MAG: nitrate reductase molybdenum cofactor assembly chaperone [Pseudomonadota bacterium]
MRRTLRALSLLLQYPSDELQAHIDDVRDVLRNERALPPRDLDALEPLLRRIARDDLLDVQSAYTDLFDRSRALALHLFEHVHGESRERGQALVDLGEQYMAAGIFLDDRELPDYAPVFVEYASCLPPREAREVLGEPAAVFTALAERLEERGSDYAAVFRALLAAAHARPDAGLLEGLREHAPDDGPETLDADWEEATVTFGSAPHDMGGATGLPARLRAVARAAGARIRN